MSYLDPDSDGFESQSSTTSSEGNPRWLAFERVNPDEFGFTNEVDARTQNSDIFEMMRTFLEVLTEQAPFATVSGQTRIRILNVQRKNPDRPAHGVIKDEMWELMKQAWSVEHKGQPSKRPPLTRISTVVSRVYHA